MFTLNTLNVFLNSFCVMFVYSFFSWHDIDGQMTLVWKKMGTIVANAPMKVVNPRYY